MQEAATEQTQGEDLTPGNDAEPQRQRNPRKGFRYAVFEDGKDITVLRVIPQDDPHYPGALAPIEGAPRSSNFKDIEKWCQKQEGLGGEQVAIIQFKTLGKIEETNVKSIRFHRKPKVRVGEAEAER